MVGRLLVFRNVRGKTVVSAVPSTPVKPSEAQKQQVQRFSEAMAYAREQMNNPAIKAGYESMARVKNMPNAFNVAVADFFHAPVIEGIDALRDEYGIYICARVTDDFWVSRVSVELHNSSGVSFEQGSAVLQPNRADWIYRPVLQQHVLENTLCIIKAYDLPGNECVNTIVIPQF